MANDPPLHWLDQSLSVLRPACSHCSQPCQSSVIICSSCNTNIFIRIENNPATSANGYVHDPSGRESISQTIQKAEEQLRHVTFLLGCLQSTRGALQFYVQHQRYRLAPIRRLPYELLAVIFEELNGPNDILLGVMPIWTLSRVCRSWRTLSFGLPRLWAHIVADVDKGAMEESYISPDVLSKRLQICVDRSKWSMLHVELIRCDEESPLLDTNKDFFHILSQAAHRIQKFTAFPDILQDWSDYTLDYSLEDFSALTHFRLCGRDLDDIRDLEVICSSPLLTSVILPPSLSIQLDYHRDIPMGRLKSLEGGFYPEDLVSADTRGIECLKFMPGYEQTTTTVDMVGLPSLHTLVVDFGHLYATEAMLETPWFSMLSCPNLRSLELGSICLSPHVTEICEMLQIAVANQTLTSLNLHGCCLEPLELEGIFSASPSLTSLSVGSLRGNLDLLSCRRSLDDVFSGTLLDKLKDGLLLPGLQVLHVRCLEDSSQIFSLVLGRARCSQKLSRVSALRSFSLSTYWDVELAPSPAQMDELRRAGFIVFEEYRTEKRSESHFSFSKALDC